MAAIQSESELNTCVSVKGMQCECGMMQRDRVSQQPWSKMLQCWLSPGLVVLIKSIRCVLIGVCGGNFLRLLQSCSDLWEVELIMYLRDFIPFQNCCLCLMVRQHQQTVGNYALSLLAFLALSSHISQSFYFLTLKMLPCFKGKIESIGLLR